MDSDTELTILGGPREVLRERFERVRRESFHAVRVTTTRNGGRARPAESFAPNIPSYSESTHYPRSSTSGRPYTPTWHALRAESAHRPSLPVLAHDANQEHYIGSPPGYRSTRRCPTWHPNIALPPAPTPPPAPQAYMEELTTIPPESHSEAYFSAEYASRYSSMRYQRQHHQRQASPPSHTPQTARCRSSIPITAVDLHERPESATFWTQAELNQRMVSIFRPLVGVVGRCVQEALGLDSQPGVKFDMFPVRADRRTGEPRLQDPRTPSRSPMFQVTLPAEERVARLEDARDALKDVFALYANPWYRQAGYVFRVRRGRRDRDGAGTRNSSGGSGRRYWVPPSCVYRVSQAEGGCYRAQMLGPVIEDVREVEAQFDYADDSEDDQDALVDEMWADVMRRQKSSYGYGNT